VVASGLPRAGTMAGAPFEGGRDTRWDARLGGMPFEIQNFVRSVPLLAWAKATGCPWNAKKTAAWHGHLDTLRWAREQHCPWDETTCECAAFGGHLKILQWAREQDCPWDSRTCSQSRILRAP